jgi:hypothetical protein
MSTVLLRYPAFGYVTWFRRARRFDAAKANLGITAVFLALLLIAGWRDHSFILHGERVGLLEHPGPWIYIVGQAALPFVVRRSIRKLKNLEQTVPGALTNAYFAAHVLEHRQFIRDWIRRRTPWSKVVHSVLMAVGFGILAWNSYSNQRPLPAVGFDFWDSISFPWGYTITRVEKLYFWVLLMPCLLHLQFLVVLRMSRLLIHAAKHQGLALKPYHEDGAGGTRALIDTVLHPLMPTFFFASMLSFGAMAMHRKFDPTTVGGLALTCVLFFLIYLVPAIALRNAIVVEKRRQMAEIARQQETLYTAIVTGKPENDDVGTIVQLSEVAAHLRRLPQWPQFAKVTRVASLAMGSPTVVWAYEHAMPLVTKWVTG